MSTKAEQPHEINIQPYQDHKFEELENGQGFILEREINKSNKKDTRKTIFAILPTSGPRFIRANFAGAEINEDPMLDDIAILVEEARKYSSNRRTLFLLEKETKNFLLNKFKLSRLTRRPMTPSTNEVLDTYRRLYPPQSTS